MEKFTYFQNILFTKVRDVKSPERANLHDAGIDFFVPEFNKEFLEDFISKNNGVSHTLMLSDCILVLPGERVLIPSGIKVWIENKESALIAANKSGISHKKGLIFTAEVVDADYTGEIHIGVLNTSNSPVRIVPGEKLIQFIHTPIFLTSVSEVSNDHYNEIVEYYGTDRGDKGFGSSDKDNSNNKQ